MLRLVALLELAKFSVKETLDRSFKGIELASTSLQPLRRSERLGHV